MKEQLNIHFEDLNDVDKTLDQFYLLIEKLLTHYNDTNEERFGVFLYSVSTYLAVILSMVGNKDINKDIQEEQE